MEENHSQVQDSTQKFATTRPFGLHTHRHVRKHRHSHRTTRIIQVEYENYPYLLTEEIYNRKGKKSRFTEVEMWFLLYSIGKAREQAFAAEEKLGDVRPKNIFLNEDGNIKVANSLTWPG